MRVELGAWHVFHCVSSTVDFQVCWCCVVGNLWFVQVIYRLHCKTLILQTINFLLHNSKLQTHLNPL